MTNTLPLAGLKVADLSWVVAGPTVGRVLADYGAIVVRVETAKRVETARVVGPFHGGVPGPEQSALYGNVNAGKLGLALDLSLEPARAVVRDLVRWADVVTEAFSPGMMHRWGLDYEALRAIKPDLIMLSTSLMGQTGPYAGYAGYGNSGAALSGFQNLVGWPDRLPIGPFGPYTDYVGPRYSLVAVLAALEYRRRSGEGCYIDHSQAESGINFLAAAFVDHFTTGRIAERAGNTDPQMAPHGVFRCRPEDDQQDAWVAIAVRSDDEWVRLAGLIGGPNLAADARFASTAARLARTDELDKLLNEWTAQRSASEVEELLQDRGIPAHKVQTSRDFADDPQLQHLGHLVRLEHPLHGETVVEASRFRLSRTPAVTDRCAPTYGRDTHLVLRDILGYDDERIAALTEIGALE
jgi:crotonobetainyl-CoA:carnitine CoA-transferase CaiB-like acyl-CoA transferase